mgnify:CR=1 FL=1
MIKDKQLYLLIPGKNPGWVKRRLSMPALSALAISVGLILVPAQESIADNNFRITPFGQLSIAQKEHDFDQLLDQDLSFYMLHAGAGFVAGDAFLAINGAWSLSDASVSEEEETGDASRTDYDLTIGYNLTEHFTLFGGYKAGETDIDYRVRDFDEDSGSDRFNDNFKEAGPYVGVSWQHFFDNASKVSISLAYAWLDAKNDLGEKPDADEENGEDEFEFDDFTGRVDSDANGFSVGVRWSIPLDEKLSYYALFRIQRYDQDLEQRGTEVSITEQFTELGMGLTYVF